MTRKNQIIIRSTSSSIYRNQPLLNHPTSSSGRIAELAGGTTAECAAVWCCFPCSVVSLLILAVYKLPAGLCRKAIRLRRRNKRMLNKKNNNALLPTISPSHSSSSSCSCSCSSSSLGGSHGGEELEWDPAEEVAVILVGDGGMDHELVQLEKEMWDRFYYSTGFWRSPSPPRVA